METKIRIVIEVEDHWRKDIKCTVGLGFEIRMGSKHVEKKEKKWIKEKWYNGRARLFGSEDRVGLDIPIPNLILQKQKWDVDNVFM
jgi:hypothetical protein